MISTAVANVLAGSTSSQQQDCSASPPAGTEGADSASFSTAMANAKAASPACNASTSEGPEAPGETPADSSQEQPTANAQTTTETPSSRAKGASADAPWRSAVTNRPALLSGRSSAPGRTAASATGPAPLIRTAAEESSDSAKGPTQAKGAAGKTASDGALPQASSTSPAEMSACAGSNGSAPADACVGALLPVIAAQTSHADPGVSSAGGPIVAAAGGAAPIASSRALEHVDASGAVGIDLTQGEGQPVSAPGQISSASGTLGGTIQSFATLFARPARAEAELPNANPAGTTGNFSLPSAGTAATASPIATLAALAGAPTHAGAALGFGPAEVNIATRVGDPGFGQDFSRQLVFLAKTGTQSAQLSLEPAELGPVSVSIQMNGLQASLVISASHALTRTALQEALPHLSELFQSSGLQLADAQVGDGSARNTNQGAGQRETFAVGNPLGPNAAVRATQIGADTVVARQASANRLIDTFA